MSWCVERVIIQVYNYTLKTTTKLIENVVTYVFP